MRSERVLALGVVTAAATSVLLHRCRLRGCWSSEPNPRGPEVVATMRSAQSRRRHGTCGRVARVVVAALVLAAMAPAIPASARVGGAGAPSARAAKTTSLTLTVHGCDGCTIQPVRAGITATSPVWRGKKKKVRNGSVHWKVSVRHTVGMSFDISDPDAVNIGAMPDIVVAYRGIAVGHRVPAGAAEHKKRANGCWAGTHKASITLRVRWNDSVPPRLSASGQGLLHPAVLRQDQSPPTHRNREGVRPDLPRRHWEPGRLLLRCVKG